VSEGAAEADLHLQGVAAMLTGSAAAGAAEMYNPLSFPGGEVAQQVRAVMELGAPATASTAPSAPGHGKDDEEEDDRHGRSAEGAYVRESMDREAWRGRGAKQTARKGTGGKPLPKPSAAAPMGRGKGGPPAKPKEPARKSTGAPRGPSGLPSRKPLVVQDSADQVASGKKRARVSPPKAASSSSSSSSSSSASRKYGKLGATAAGPGGGTRGRGATKQVVVLDSSSEELESVSDDEEDDSGDSGDSDDTQWAQMH
jgi:hypothetical protein